MSEISVNGAKAQQLDAKLLASGGNVNVRKTDSASVFGNSVESSYEENMGLELQHSQDDKKQKRTCGKDKSNGMDYVSYANEDGKEVHRQYIAPDGGMYYIDYEYDSQGRKYRETGYSDIREITEKVYKYDSDNKETFDMNLYKYKDSSHNILLSKKEMKASGEVIESQYDVKGNVTKKVEKDSDGNVTNLFEYTYNSSGKLQQEIWNRIDPYFFEEPGIKVTDYDADKKVIAETYKNPNGEIKYTNEYGYDNNEKTSITCHTYANGKLDHTYISYLVDNKEEKISYSNGKKVHSQESYYDNNGHHLTKEVEKDAGGNVVGITMYKYDDNHFLVNQETESYEYANTKCTKSTLADKLYNQISGPSLNKNTIALLKELTPENVIKVMTSYQEISGGESLRDALKAEWFMESDGGLEILDKVYQERLKHLGLNQDASLDDIVRSDYNSDY